MDPGSIPSPARKPALTDRPPVDRDEDFELEENLALVERFGVETDSVDEDGFGVAGLLGNDFKVSMS